MANKSTTTTTTTFRHSSLFLFTIITIISSLSISSQQISASGVFEINLSSLVDSFGRDLRFDCCAWQNYTSSQQHAAQHNSHHLHHHYQQQRQPCDPNKCQLIVRICVKNYQTQIDPSQCTFGELSAQVMRPNEPIPYVHYPQYAHRVLHPTLANVVNNNKQRILSPSSSASANIHLQRMLNQQLHQTPYVSAPAANQQPGTDYQHILFNNQPRALRTIAFDEPITFPFNFTWPGSYSLIIDAWYESPTGLQQVHLPFARDSAASAVAAQQNSQTTYDLYKKQLIIKHSMHGWLAVKNEWTFDVHKTDAATLTYSYRVTCQQNYFGDQCNILCRPRDDVYGHYTCSPQGNIVCLPGWSGSYCLDPICSPGCHKEQGNCSRPNECNCRVGWQGPSCDQCVKYPGCVHGSCSKPHECTCEEGWGGLLCNEDLNFCAHHRPCKNGALCTNIFDSHGIGSYSCSCEEGFTGKNCEKRIDQQQQVANVQQQPTQINNTSSNYINNQKNIIVKSQSNSSRLQASKPIHSAQQMQDVPVNNLLAQHYGPHSVHGGQWGHLIQPINQHPPLDHGLIAAYGTIIVCMLILVVWFLLRVYFERSTQRQWNQESTHVDVATLQNHQNIYKSRTSLTTDKMPYDTVDSSSGCSSGSSSTNGSNGNMNHGDHHIYHHYNPYQLDSRDRGIYSHHLSHPNLHHSTSATSTATRQKPLNPPPPYTASTQSHPNSTYASNSTYNTSIYNHPGTVSTIGSSPKTNSTAATSAYGDSHSTPTYVIYRLPY